ncbi:microcystin-dependent protein [Bradyrhizobium japonicum]|uniref:phage tail protein n=1 Tax=Bradyrhizobium japonicum TaxID=375 RepID=UPI0021676968|nr:tail fiber protein [Bradyrhizobium japonicum]MCS3503717.1 microcystin-dependent protein [Bradyrhizobium japonicum]MCS3963564.1 microcystin-dependent protein [Bradyrhizobium japonicum]MCS3995877.1 microcystin-dependent protein [Bradyrhizobium japonicum]
MPSGFYIWSETAAANGTADGAALWPEGMSPSAVNDSARAMMAVLRRWGTDISGGIVTTGSSTAYAIASHSTYDTLAHLDGQMIAFTPHTTSGATVTLNVDGLGAKAVRSGPGIELPSGTLVQGTPYVATYNNADSAFYLHGLLWNPYNVPIGACIDFFGSTAPNSSFVLAYGQAISRTTYATLFSMFSTTYGAGDGTTTFNVPDLRGRVVAGKGDMGGSDAGRLTSGNFGANPGALGAAGGSESHTLTTAQLASHSHANTLSDPGHAHDSFANNTARASSGGIGGGPVVFVQLNNSDDGNMITDVRTTGVSINNVAAGSGSAHNNTQPTIIANKLIRII